MLENKNGVWTGYTAPIGPESGRVLHVDIPMDEPEEITHEFAAKMGELIKLFDSKQKDYGSGNISKFGRMGIGVRMNDKWERIMHLTGNFSWGLYNTEVRNESLRDSYMDIAVYAVIDWLVEEGIWDAS